MPLARGYEICRVLTKLGRSFLAGVQPDATWFTELKPALGAGTFLPY